MAQMLTQNTITRLRSGEKVERPVLQILAYKLAGDTQNVCRVIMSDGEYSDQSFILVGTELLNRLKKGEFERFTIVQLSSYNLSNVDGKLVVTIDDLFVVKKGVDVKDKIGKPKAYNKTVPLQSNQADNRFDGGNTGAVAAQAAPPAASPARPTGRPYLGQAGASPSLKAAVCPIAAINPYQGKFTIKGRVTSKTAIKTWSKPTSEGKLFSFDLQDKTGGIRVTAFNAECDRFFEMIDIGKVVLVARGSIKQANRRFCDYEYEMSLSNDSIVELVSEEDSSVPQINFNFKKIGELESTPENELVDVAAVVVDVGEVSTIHSTKLARDLKKRDISLVDDSSVKIALTLWNADADSFTGEPGNVVVAKKLKVSEYNGRSLSTTSSGAVLVNPNLEVTQTLKDWWSYSKDSLHARSLTTESGGGRRDWKLLFQGWAEALGSDRVFMDARVRIAQFNRVQFYEACIGMNADRPCRKKVDRQGDQFYCSACNRTYDSCRRRLILSCKLMDETGEIWVSLFDDDVCKLFDWTPEDIDAHNEESLKDATKQFLFMPLTTRVGFRKEFYQEKQRIKPNAGNIQKLDPVMAGRKMISYIRKLKMAA